MANVDKLVSPADVENLAFTSYPVEVCGANFYITATAQSLKILRDTIDAALADSSDEVLVKNENIVMNPAGIGHYIFIHKLNDTITSERWKQTGGLVKNANTMYNFTELARSYADGHTTLRYPWLVATSIKNVEI